jgi:hypothetical protein
MDGNPLRRGIDRVERALWLLLAVAFVIAVPLLVPMAGNVTRADNLRLLTAERSWHEVRAVLLAPAPARVDGFSTSAVVWVSGRWQAPSGARHTGLVPTTPGTPAGSRVPIWVDRHGAVTDLHPVTAGVVMLRTIMIEILTAIGLAMTAAGLGCLVRWLMNKRRMAYWAVEWACFGPRWSARH